MVCIILLKSQHFQITGIFQQQVQLHYLTTVHHIHKIQAAQNSLAGAVLMGHPHLPSSSFLQELYWLHIHSQITFKLAGLLTRHSTLVKHWSSFTFAVTITSVQTYLNISLYWTASTKTANFINRAFAYVAGTIWNKFPPGIKCSTSRQTFKCRHKTHLFTVQFITLLETLQNVTHLVTAGVSDSALLMFCTL